MNVLQADEQNARAKVLLVGAHLNQLAQFRRRADTTRRHDFLRVHAGEVVDRLAHRQFFEQLPGVRMATGPREEVGDLILHRDADGEQVHRHGLFGRSAVARRLAELLAAGDEQVELLFIVGARPEQRAFLVELRVGNETYVETLNLTRAEGVDFINGPRPFEMQARPQHRTRQHRPSEAFEQGVLVRVDDDERRRKPDDARLQQVLPD